MVYNIYLQSNSFYIFPPWIILAETNLTINLASLIAGFTEVKVACCGAGNLNGTIPCNRTTIPCSNRTNHVFWDGVHNTQAVAKVYMNIAFQGSAPYVYPINVKQLSD